MLGGGPQNDGRAVTTWGRRLHCTQRQANIKPQSQPFRQENFLDDLEKAGMECGIATSDFFVRSNLVSSKSGRIQ